MDVNEIIQAAAKPVQFSVEPHEGEWLHKLHLAGKWYGLTAKSELRTDAIESMLRSLAGIDGI